MVKSKVWYARNETRLDKSGIILRFCEIVRLPSPKPTLTLSFNLGQNVGLGEGQVGSFPET